MRTLTIIPTYNEKENIALVVRGVLSFSDSDALVIDDGSPDGTADVVRMLCAENNPRVRLLERPRKSGLGSAYRDGFRIAATEGYAAVCEMDADGSHEPCALPLLIAQVRAGADLAVGSRRVAGGSIVGWGPHRHAMSFGAATLSRLLLGLRTKDVTSGFRCYTTALSAKILEKGVQSDGYAFQEETLFHAERAGAKVVEVPIVFLDRTVGQSKLGWRDIVQFFLVIRRLRRSLRQ